MLYQEKGKFFFELKKEKLEARYVNNKYRDVWGKLPGWEGILMEVRVVEQSELAIFLWEFEALGS